MNETEADPDLQRLFTTYDPAICAQPFLEQTFAGLNREIRRARMRSALSYALAGLLVIGLAATTAAPLSGVMATLENSFASLASHVSPLKAQALIYAATLGLLALARRRLSTFLAPW
ncbi:MAG: hypothetical protein WA825_03620 [Steroidobacteraceae bacterium]